MRVVGVALSSVFSRCCACLAFWILLDYRTHLRLRARDFVTIDWQKVGRDPIDGYANYKLDCVIGELR